MKPLIPNEKLLDLLLDVVCVIVEPIGESGPGRAE